MFFCENLTILLFIPHLRYHPKSSAAMMTKPMTKPEKMRMATKSMMFVSLSVSVGSQAKLS